MTSPARSRPSRENPPLKLGQMDQLRSWHHERLAVVYVRQSTAQQVLVHGESTRLHYGLVTRAEAYGWTRERILVIDETTIWANQAPRRWDGPDLSGW